MIKELEAVRAAKKAARRLWDEYQALSPSVVSPRMDGMPRSGMNGDREAQLVDLRQEAMDRYTGAMIACSEAEKRARAQMDGLTPWLYSLCLYYYISAMTMEETMEIMHISESTFKRYKADLSRHEPSVTLA